MALNITSKVPDLASLDGAYDVYTLQRIGFKYYPEVRSREERSDELGVRYSCE